MSSLRNVPGPAVPAKFGERAKKSFYRETNKGPALIPDIRDGKLVPPYNKRQSVLKGEGLVFGEEFRKTLLG